MLFVLILTWVGVPALADDLFRLPLLDYFGEKARLMESVREDPGWADPGLQAPQVVIDLLQAPSPAAARRYLQWHRIRLERIAAAQRMIEQVEAGDGP